MAGLKDEVHREIVLLMPRTLQAAMGMARVAEQKLYPKGVGGMKQNFTRIAAPPPVTSARDERNSVASKLPFKKLTVAEMAARRERGLCFNCPERFTIGHKCQPKFQCIVMTEMEDNEDGECAEQSDQEECEGETSDAPSISLHAMQGCPSPSTLRLEGELGGRKVIVLVDSGSTHNFLQTRVASHLGLSTEVARHMSVKIGNGDEMVCEGVCRDLKLGLGGQIFEVDFHLLPIYGADAVLGAQWLAKIGPATFDYNELWMSMQRGGREVKLHGITRKAQLANLSLGQLKKATRSKSIASCFMMTIEHKKEVSTSHVEDLPKAPTDLSEHAREDLRAILQEFSRVFMTPRGLPPQREWDHCIPLLPGSAPVSVRPYRYPRFQKQEIEKLVGEMLAEGVIRPSASPFSSPVLLVKKKDGTWRFCVDYRALNAATVRDRFPIPTVDELFDELGGASVFSKLDLRSGYHQVRMHTDDIHKTAFRTHDGHYEFLVMPFGLTNAPSTFQAAMNDMFRPVLRKYVLVFMDDILVYSKTWDEHMGHLRRVLELLAEYSFVAKGSKCEIACSRVRYLGHVISGEGMEVDVDKVEAVQGWPIPKDVR